MHQFRYEHAIYGSFAFRPGGYGLLASSPGCRPEWLASFVSACQKFGEPAGVATFDRALFSLKLSPQGPWAIVGISPAGHDDRGRPGALGFHGLFVEDREFRKLGYDPFVMATELRFEWTEEPPSCRAGYYRPSATGSRTAGNSRPYKPINRLIAGRRVAIESAEPIEELAREIWLGLPEKIRKKASMATWAFSNANHFDLVAVPRLEAIEWDASYAELPEQATSIRAALPWRKIAYLVAAVCVLMASILLRMKAGSRDRPTPPRSQENFATTAIAPGPDRASYRDDSADPAEIRDVSQGLAEFAGRFGIPLDGDPPGPSEAMIRLADRLRYHGRLLSETELSQLAKENVPGRSRAMAWDALIRHFAADRPLPPGFENGPLRWQIDTLAWSFHLDPFDRLATSEVPRAMADALTRDEPIGANPLASRYPALAEYARFLAKLPGP